MKHSEGAQLDDVRETVERPGASRRNGLLTSTIFCTYPLHEDAMYTLSTQKAYGRVELMDLMDAR